MVNLLIEKNNAKDANDAKGANCFFNYNPLTTRAMPSLTRIEPKLINILGAGINLTFGNPRLPPGAIHIQPLRGCAF